MHSVAVRGYARVRDYELQFPFETGDLRNATAVGREGGQSLGEWEVFSRNHVV